MKNINKQIKIINLTNKKIKKIYYILCRVYRFEDKLTLFKDNYKFQKNGIKFKIPVWYIHYGNGVLDLSGYDSKIITVKQVKHDLKRFNLETLIKRIDE